ncbi:MAG: hypothetical protein WBW81_03085 [Methylocella sp.]
MLDLRQFTNGDGFHAGVAATKPASALAINARAGTKVAFTFFSLALTALGRLLKPDFSASRLRSNRGPRNFSSNFVFSARFSK